MNAHLPRALCALLWLAAPAAFSAPIDQLQSLDDIGPNKIPHLGDSQVLIIPSRVGRDLTDDERTHLQTHYAPDGPFQRYWTDVSRGAYVPHPVLADTVVFDSCPLEDRPEDDCRVTLEDLGLLISGNIADVVRQMLVAVRDEQGLDLGQFDINGKDQAPDGYFDAVVIDTDLYGGIALPLAAFSQGVSVLRTTADAAAGQGAPIDVGIVAFVPPDQHEYAHLFGFIDHYDGQGGDGRPTITGLMGHNQGPTLSAYSRMVIGWGTVQDLSEAGDVELAPVMPSGEILRVGAPPRYALLENRAGPQHAEWDSEFPGLYIYAIDEDQLPEGELGFLRLLEGELYYPNKTPPYLNVNLPLDCLRGQDLGETGLPCELLDDGRQRNIRLPDGTFLGSVEVTGVDGDGALTLHFDPTTEAPAEAVIERTAPPEPEPELNDIVVMNDCGGCDATGPALVPLAAGLLLLLGARRRRRPPPA